ncbi:hypothetical protein ACJW31_05G207500 [Castanea mollissima]
MAMAVVESIENLVSARQLLQTSLEKSRTLASALDKMGPRLEETNQRLPSLEAAARSISIQQCAFSRIRDHVDRAIGPAVAVLKVFDTARELEKSLLSDPCSDLFDYLSVMNLLEEALKFLSDNCELAMKWLEGIFECVEDNAITNDCCLLNVKKSLRILQELQVYEERARLEGGALSAASRKLEIEFKRLLLENSVPLALDSLATSTAEQASVFASSSWPVPVIQKLQAIVQRLNSDNQLECCMSVYVDVQSSNAKHSLQALGLDYLEMSITKFDDVQSIEGYIDQWSKHLVLAVKHVYELEHRLCNDVFKKIGSEVATGCFSKIASQSGILAFLRFGKHVAESKKDPIKLLKLLDMFASLNNLRFDFNRLFGGEGCIKIKNQTRDLIRKIVDGACEIFWELPLQVELQRRSSPPSDGSVPKLISFVTCYCNQLLGDDYRPILTQVLVIHQSWKQEKSLEGLIPNQVHDIMKEIGLNLDAWSKAYEDISLSYLFMMNNHCHFRNLKGTKLGDMMGDSWLTAHEQYRDFYAVLYLKKSWQSLLAPLSQKGLTSLSGEDLVERLTTFNDAFDDCYKKQSNWIICNEILREKVCKHLVQAIIPVYMCYVQNFSLLVEQDANAGKYVKYSVQNLEKMLSSLFQPNLTSLGVTKQGLLLGNVKSTRRGMENMVSSLFQQKLRRYGSIKQAHWIGKIKNFVTNQFHLTVTAI